MYPQAHRGNGVATIVPGHACVISVSWNGANGEGAQRRRRPP